MRAEGCCVLLYNCISQYIQVGVRENEAAKQVILAVSSTDQKDRERTHTKGSQGF